MQKNLNVPVADPREVPVISDSFNIKQLELLCFGYRNALAKAEHLSAKEIVMIGSQLIKYEQVLNQFYSQSGQGVGISVNEVVHQSAARIEDTLAQDTGLTNTIPRSPVKTQEEINYELQAMGFVPAPGKAQVVDFSQFVNHDYDDDDALMDL